MRKLHIRGIVYLFGLVAFVIFFHAHALCQEPTKVTLCQLESDPSAYDHKMIEVTSFVSHGFEDFTLFDPSCSSRPDVWLEYGGVVASGTMYCCGVRADRRRSKRLVVENQPISLVDDARFREFDKLVQRPPDSVVHATLIGRFFSGRQKQKTTEVFGGGYGHMGCCSLLAIQQVLSVDPQDSTDLDYRASADQPNIDRVGCGYRSLLPDQAYGDVIENLKKAESRQSEWAFDDPHQVASDALAHLLKLDENLITDIKETRKAQGRIVYEARAKGNQETYMVVISRPYVLTFYARDPKRIPWIAIAAYEVSCR